ncbi:nitroreductase family protein [Planctomicrobium sp. SH527]|uniref:nitroreductase family protein n=1 Tax=Planctomicrobium sp. SH527 TaxID=3448123 RepID=UPI003F5BB347
MSQQLVPESGRVSDHEILDVILNRWSPRAFTGEPVCETTVKRLFEAARWAPSASNEQEWRFLYAHKESPIWNTYFNLLADGNKIWCERAGVLIVVISKKTLARNGNPNPVHSLDTGMALQNLLLQASSIPGLFAHCLGGFDRAQTLVSLGIPDDYQVECMVAVGHFGAADLLSPELLAREKASARNPVSQFARQGKFDF